MQTTRIKSFKSIGVKPTIDFEVDHKDHNFYAEGLVTSNSHSISYAYMAAYTVWLKANYPKQFYTSLLKMAKNEPDTFLEIQKISQELGRKGIRLLKPDLIKSRMDFAVEGDNIRYGLNCVKGVAEKTLDGLRELRDLEVENKFELFDSAKEVGINIGVLSSLIYAGVLDEMKIEEKSRGYLALEAQAYNILTDREKRVFSEIGQEYDWMLLEMIADLRNEQAKASDNKDYMKESRFNTFKNKFTPYKAIYMKNKQKEEFAHWYFENTLLGYTYSKPLRELMQDKSLIPIKDIESVNKGDISFVGTVSEAKEFTAQSGNRCFKMDIYDETGTQGAMLMDNKFRKNLTEFKDRGNVLPEEKEIVIVKGKKLGDMIFVDSLTQVTKDVYLKFSEMK